MSSLVRVAIVLLVGLWSLGTLSPSVRCVWQACPSNGLDTDFDGVVDGVVDGSPAERAGIMPDDRIVAPMPHGLFQKPPPPLTFSLEHQGSVRRVTLAVVPMRLSLPDKVRQAALILSYLIFVIVGSALLLLRPSAMTWSFYLYCVLRRYGDLWFYLPGSNAFFWTNFLIFAVLGGASCALVTIFALRFPGNRLDGWRRRVNRVALALAVLFPVAWLYVIARIGYYGLPAESLVNVLVIVTSIVYLGAAAIFVITLIQSRGDARQRLQWILVFPAVLVLRIVAINFIDVPWLSDVLIALAVCIPLSVAYAVIRRRVFDIEFAISRALVYGVITTIVAGVFLLIDWFMSRQFAQTRFTLTAEVVVALALGSCLNMLHHSVDRFVDSTFFRQRHLAEKRLAKAAAAVLRAESDELVAQFLVHEPMRALDLVSAALFHRHANGEHFAREVAVGWGPTDVHELSTHDPLVLHLLAEGAPVRLADLTWSSDELPILGKAVIAMPVLLRDQLVSIVLYGPHVSGADIDPDEVRSLTFLVERAGAAYDHIEARALRAEVESLSEQCRAKEQKIGTLLAELDALTPRTPDTSGSA
jgi:hypothetical protein